ncbi:PepSY domain-containing protein [Kistimonas asteriae]|uniref:PepSY domain-containing protein n=1 Tax=Kistimonas asteriae TaxID=517724 RepID=UPI001BA6EA92|nr:PepSY domain-containing protein [Kistimonas asteriae]
MKAFKISVAIACGSLITCATLPAFASQTGGTATHQTQSDAPVMPLEKLLVKAKDKHPGMRIINTYSETTQKGKHVEKIYYLMPDNTGAWIMTLDRTNGKILDDHPYKFPEKADVIPLEKILQEVKEKYHVKKIVRTRLEQENGRKLRVIYYIDKLKQQRTMVVDEKTGAVLSDKARKLTPTG